MSRYRADPVPRAVPTRPKAIPSERSLSGKPILVLLGREVPAQVSLLSIREMFASTRWVIDRSCLSLGPHSARLRTLRP